MYLNFFVKKGLSNSLNGRQPSLTTDIKNAIKPPAIYDTDIENYDTNPSKNTICKKTYI